MKAKVRLFARLADLAGTRETEVELGEGLSVAEAFRVLCQRFPEMAGPPEGLFEATAEPLDPQRLITHVRRDESGAVAVFLGVVRDSSMGRRVLYLEYDAYPEMATRVMRQIAEEAMARWRITGVAMQPRTGRLEIGGTSLLIAVSPPHRREAFEAC